jgi:SAM-dependent methyltransferase
VSTIPYAGRAFPRTHPVHLSAMARRHGVPAADPAACRVIELACGDGLNAVAMAAADPGVSVTAVDIDPDAIAVGQEAVAALGLGDRADLRVADIGDVPDLGAADFVVCHGLYAWVPEPIRAAALATIAGSLAPAGVAFLSFNLRPGWLVRQGLAEGLRRHASDFGAVRDLLAQLGPALAGRDDVYARLLGEQVARLSGWEDHLVMHDDLGPHTTSFWNGDVAAAAAANGLRVLCDGDPEAPQPDELTDLVSGRAYRELLLVGEDAAIGEPLPAIPGRARYASEPGERPVGYALARWQAARGPRVTTLRHTSVTIPDAAGRVILALCDGSRDRAALAADAARAPEAGVTRAELEAAMDDALDRLAASALLQEVSSPRRAAPRSPAA